MKDFNKNIKKILMRYRLKKTVRRLIEGIHFHRKSDLPNVLIYSTPRSGSTWLFDLIGLNPGFKAINEPLHKNGLINDYLKNPSWRYACLSKSEQALLKQYFDDCILRKMSNYPVSKSQHRWLTNRALIKCLRAPGLLEWFIQTFDFYVIFLVRHPIPVCLSRLRSGWYMESQEAPEEIFKAYYDCPYFKQYVFTEKVQSLIQEKLQEDNELNRQVIRWSLENIKALRKIGELKINPRFLLLTYEELVIRTEKVIDHFAEVLNLPVIDEMKRSIETPSGSSKYSLNKTKSAISDGKKKYLIEKWKDQISTQQETEVSEILSAFNIDIYNRNSIYPNKSYTNFL